MAERGSSSREAKEHAEKAARKASPWIEALARSGYVAKGTVYAAIGVLAAREATGTGGGTTGLSGVVQSTGSQPFGKVLLLVLAAGLLGYALWKMVQGLMDPEDNGKDATGVVRRVGYAGSGIIHGSLAFVATQEVFNPASGSGTKDDVTARILAQPFGQWLVALVGLVIIGVGFYQLYASLRCKFRDELKLEEMSEGEKHWTIFAGSLGTTARAVVIGIA